MKESPRRKNPALSQPFPLLSLSLSLLCWKVLETLLASPLCDPDRPNIRGETALMYCSQREGYATGDTQVLGTAISACLVCMPNC